MIKTVGIFPNPTKQDWLEVTEKIVRFLREKKTDVAMEPSFLSEHPVKGVDTGSPLTDADIIISLGGDGTLLNLVGRIGNCNQPIMGVNLGSLGFLTEFTIDSLFRALDKVIKGDFTVESRITLHSIVTRNGEKIAEHTALNDVVITHEKLARLITIKAFFDETHITTYQADGLIICTPTGSTAYSLSAGGPIVEPTLDAILLTPICPHTITNRPILVPGNRKIEIVLPETGMGAILTIDGQTGVEIEKDDIIEVQRSKKGIKLIQSPETSFFDVLRDKLKWSGSKSFNKS